MRKKEAVVVVIRSMMDSRACSLQASHPYEAIGLATVTYILILVFILMLLFLNKFIRL